MLEVRSESVGVREEEESHRERLADAAEKCRHRKDPEARKAWEAGPDGQEQRSG